MENEKLQRGNVEIKRRMHRFVTNHNKIFDLSHKITKDNKNIYRQGRCWNVECIQEKHKGKTSNMLEQIIGAVS